MQTPERQATEASAPVAPRTATRVRADLTWGIKAGLTAAAVFSCWATAVYLITGGGALEARNVGLLPVVGAYAAAGITGGALVGLLRPLTRSRAGSYFVGYLAGSILLVALVTAVVGPPSIWNPAHWIGTLVAAGFAARGIGGELASARR